jgi:hypothetical protein
MIRSELQPPQCDQETLDRLTEVADQVLAAVDSGTPSAGLIAEFNAATQRGFTVSDFLGAAGSMTMREFTRGALMPEPRRVPGVTREDLLEIVRHVRGERAGLLPESELGYWIQFLAANIPHPHISELLFYSEHLETAEQVLDEALRHRPFVMPAPR